MGKPDELTAKERRQFEDLIRIYFEYEAYDPHTGDVPRMPPGPPAHRDRRIWPRWRWWRRGGVDHPG